MNERYLNKIKKENSWLFDNDKKYYLVVTDDLDSVMSALLILQYRKNWEIAGFLDYDQGLYQDLNLFVDVNLLNDDNVIYVDCSVPRSGVKCISNHLTSIDSRVYNACDVNLNTLNNNYRDKDYFEKYNLSTFLLLVSIFKHEIDNEVGRILSLCFDASYKAYYQPPYFADSRVQKRYLCDVLNLHDIYNVQADITKEKFLQITSEQNLYSKVYAAENGLKCYKNVDLEMLCKYLNINVSLEKLQGIFGMIKRCKSYYKSVEYVRNKTLQDNELLSFAIVNKNNVCFSLIS